jgi:hypothetical protein
VIVCFPDGRPDVLKRAFPCPSLNLASLWPPSVNVTKPVGLGRPFKLPVTEEKNVTASPKVDGFGELVTWIRVPVLFNSTLTLLPKEFAEKHYDDIASERRKSTDGRIRIRRRQGGNSLLLVFAL